MGAIARFTYARCASAVSTSEFIKNFPDPWRNVKSTFRSRRPIRDQGSSLLSQASPADPPK